MSESVFEWCGDVQRRMPAFKAWAQDQLGQEQRLVMVPCHGEVRDDAALRRAWLDLIEKDF